MGKGDIFSEMIRPIDPAKGITTRDYLDALDFNVKEPIKFAFWELCEAINGLPENEMRKADGLLSIQRAALMLWEQIDEKILKDCKEKREVAK